MAVFNQFTRCSSQFRNPQTVHCSQCEVLSHAGLDIDSLSLSIYTCINRPMSSQYKIVPDGVLKHNLIILSKSSSLFVYAVGLYA